jgi:hypothetical protein
MGRYAWLYRTRSSAPPRPPWTASQKVDFGGGPKYLLGDGHRGHRFGPAGVKREVGDCLDQFRFGDAVVLGPGQVEDELVGRTAGLRASIMSM